jgi:hypothetical protein
MSTPLIAPALSNAVMQLTGVRLRHAPFTSERAKKALGQAPTLKSECPRIGPGRLRAVRDRFSEPCWGYAARRPISTVVQKP